MGNDTSAERANCLKKCPQATASSSSGPEFFKISGASLEPAGWDELDSWTRDDHASAFATFQASCRPIVRSQSSNDMRPVHTALQTVCARAVKSGPLDTEASRHFFEANFRPIRIRKLGDAAGFLTGYYEPIVEGSRFPTREFTVPLYRRPQDLLAAGATQPGGPFPNTGGAFRRTSSGALVPYYDRGEIEDGAIAGRGLEICWLKEQTDLLFAQIQGSARIKLQDGSTVRINYDAHNGYPYTAVGRILIDRGIIPKEQMSMQKIREWMEQNPDGAKELRRQNRSYIFFREVNLSDKDEAVGAQGVPLTPGRSIAVDKSLHVYGTPFFIEGELPIESEQARTPFHRLMIAQDTGSAITGPARADLYFGAGADAGKVSGRLRHNMRFVMLVPKSLDPVERGRKLPIPDPRPSETIAKLFPQTPAKQQAKDQTGAVPSSTSTVAQASAAIPLPEARPRIAPTREQRHQRRRYRRSR